MTTQERKKQLKNRKFYGTTIFIGVILFVCGICKLVPGFENPIETIISAIIAYGFILGLGFIGFGIGGLICDK